MFSCHSEATQDYPTCLLLNIKKKKKGREKGRVSEEEKEESCVSECPETAEDTVTKY